DARRYRLKRSAERPSEQGVGAADKKASQRGNAIPPYLRAPGSFKRLLGSTLGAALARTKGLAGERNRCHLVLVLVENVAGLLTLKGGNSHVFVVKEFSECPHSGDVLGCRRL